MNLFEEFSPLCAAALPERFIHLQFCLDYNLDFSSRDAQIRSSRILNLIFCPTNIMETTNLKAVARPSNSASLVWLFEIEGLSSLEKNGILLPKLF